jgi:hypothetical protein
VWPINWWWRFTSWLQKRFGATADSRFTRFIFSRSDFNAQKSVIRHRVFMPRPDGAVSVFDTDKLNERQVWDVGTNVANDRNQSLHARADITNGRIVVHGLRVIRDEPPPRHRNIIGWPPAEQKEDQKLIAMELAAAAMLHLP